MHYVRFITRPCSSFVVQEHWVVGLHLLGWQYSVLIVLIVLFDLPKTFRHGKSSKAQLSSLSHNRDVLVLWYTNVDLLKPNGVYNHAAIVHSTVRNY